MAAPPQDVSEPLATDATPSANCDDRYKTVNGTAPFPPYHERDAPADGMDVCTYHEDGTYATTTTSPTHAETPCPPPSAPQSQQVPPAEPPIKPPTDPPDTSPSPSPPPPAPPPYWTHSCAETGLHDSALSTGPRWPAVLFAAAAPDSALTKPEHRRPPAALPPSLQGVVHDTVRDYHHHQHHRDISASSSVLRFNPITLQDNETPEQGGDGLVPPDATSFCTAGSSGNGEESGPRPKGTAASHAPLASLQAKSTRCWARRVDVTDHIVVHGNGPAPGVSRLGAFVVWTVRVETLEGTSFSIHKRYSEFDTLRRHLAASFPLAAGNGGSFAGGAFGGRHKTGGGGSARSSPHISRPSSSNSKRSPPTALPPLPPKAVLGNLKPEFLEQRRLGLQYFLK